ncbi:hypothetical protein SAMN05444392_101666 [Seinonella peptonophila]|uniref:Uncharacterized protein n=1 Tax=Seinonella peptonophila TaxID=112248 RepID=A0A1M4TVQ5_9BACL|nr:hypothetical protein [Seinonella peptonophila]SHE48483.1 hypothetical protein SAMN05444392_101666 [Seinonella peptonophila]
MSYDSEVLKTQYLYESVFEIMNQIEEIINDHLFESNHVPTTSPMVLHLIQYMKKNNEKIKEHVMKRYRDRNKNTSTALGYHIQSDFIEVCNYLLFYIEEFQQELLRCRLRKKLLETEDVKIKKLIFSNEVRLPS